MFLFADSQTLFWRDGKQLFLDRVAQYLDSSPQSTMAAYLGASNGELPEFFELFQQAVAAIGITGCMHVRARGDQSQLAFLEEAGIILLAGGDVALGYRAFEEAGLVERLRRAWSEGAILMGVSAGAVQIGSGDSGSGSSLLSLFPYVVAVHEEPDWTGLCASIGRLGADRIGLGIPLGGAAIVYPDLTVEPIRKPITEVVLREGTLEMRQVLSSGTLQKPPWHGDPTLN